MTVGARAVLLLYSKPAGFPACAVPDFPLFTVDQALRTSAAENDQQPLAINGHSADPGLIKPHEIVSVRITGPQLTHAAGQEGRVTNLKRRVGCSSKVLVCPERELCESACDFSPVSNALHLLKS